MSTGPLYDVAMAQTINRLHGGPVIASWDVPYLDDVTLDLYRALAADAPKLKQNVAKVEAAKAKYWQPFEKRKH